MKQKLLPAKLRELRKAHSYTQDYVASALGIVRQTYSHYETGKRTPNYETLYKLAGLYNISIDDLLQVSLELDRNIYYDAPAPTLSGRELKEYLEYFNNPKNQKKYKFFGDLEKKMLYFFEKLPEEEKKELVAFAEIKARKFK